jgi:hypothetical protein
MARSSYGAVVDVVDVLEVVTVVDVVDVVELVTPPAGPHPFHAGPHSPGTDCAPAAVASTRRQHASARI